MSRFREKRWAAYLARAVDRYEAWWASLGGRPATLDGMEARGNVAYEMFPFKDVGTSMVWEESFPIPLGTLTMKAVSLVPAIC